MSGWGYLSSASPSPTALIPLFFGVALLLCYPGIKKENKIIAHVAVLLTLIVLVALFMPLKGAIGIEKAEKRVGLSFLLLNLPGRNLLDWADVRHS